MSLLDGFRHRLRLLRSPSQHAREHADELAFHLEREAAQHAHDARAPVSPADALASARRATGNLTHVSEATRSAAGLSWLDTAIQDIRFAVRSFRSTPGFTTVVILTLALGIGGTTAIFSAVDAVLLRPLPFASPERLMSVSLSLPPLENRPIVDDVQWSYPKFLEFKRLQTVFSDVTVWTSSSFTLRVNNATYRLDGEYTDSRYLPTLGIPLALGRNFLPAEDRFGVEARVLILSHSLWRNAFSSSAAVIGTVVSVDGFAYTIVGVAAETFSGISGESAIWMPLASAPVGWGANEPYNHSNWVVARLADSVSVEQSFTAVRALGARIDEVFPDRNGADRKWGAVARELDAARTHPRVIRTLVVLLGAVALVLLTACVNVANLLLIRASSRQREMAVRLALGASRMRLLRQLFAESLVLAVVGAAASIAVAFVAVKFLAAVQPTAMGGVNGRAGLGLSSFSTIQFDLKTLAVTAVLAIVTAVLFGLAPALVATGRSVQRAIKEGDNSAAVGRGRISLRHALTVAEIAFAVVLLTASGLMIRSVQHLLNVPTGFNSEQVLSMRVNRAAEWSKDSIATFYDGALLRIAAQPGVRAVAMSDCPPMVRCATASFAHLNGVPVPESERPRVGLHWITPDWPKVLSVPLVRGRLFNRSDDTSAPPVVLVSELAARKFWPGEDPIGRRILLDGDALKHDSATVVGILSDVRFDALESDPHPDVYVSYYQSQLTWRMMFFVRGAQSSALTARLVSVLRRFAPGFPVYDVRNLQARVDEQSAYARITMIILASFAAVALALAMIGTYGVVAYAVSQRTREIGVRVALGASNAHITRLFAGQGIALAVVGLGVGGGLAAAATRALRSMLFETAPSDPVTLAGIVVVLSCAVIGATWFPARRAMRVTPAAVLRNS